MASEILVDELANNILNELNSYSKEVEKELKDIITVYSQDIVKSLKNDKNIPTRTGKYRKNFFAKKLDDRQGSIKVIIANKIYKLTHLLENGHITSNGKRTKEYPHWKTQQEKLDLIVQKLKKRLEK